MPDDKRQKASDVFRETNFFLAKKSRFQAFPQIATLSGTVEEDGDGVSERFGVRSLGKDTGEYFDCSNPLCYNKEDTRLCEGYEGSPKGRRRYQDCMNSFRIKVDIKYRDGDR